MVDNTWWEPPTKIQRSTCQTLKVVILILRKNVQILKVATNKTTILHLTICAGIALEKV